MRRHIAGFVLFAGILMSQAGSAAEIEIELGQQSYRVELAVSSAERRRGLMYRKKLGPRVGMLLVYSSSGDHRIWMKNVLIPLKVYWIDDQLKVLEVQSLSPCTSDPCPIYSSSRPSRFVLELDDGQHPIQPGDKIDSLRDLL